VNLALGSISTSTAIVGFKKTSKCRDAKSQLAARQRAERREAMPPDVGAPATAVQSVTVTPGSDTLAVGGAMTLGPRPGSEVAPP